MSVSPLPRRGGVQADARADGRFLRVAAHPEAGMVVLSLWQHDRCVATHQVATADVPALIELLAGALVPAPASRASAS